MRPELSSVTNPLATTSGAAVVPAPDARRSSASASRKNPLDPTTESVRPKSSEREVAKAAAHGVADEQRAREHGHRRRHAERDRQVRAPVVPGTAQ